ncbi:hypothetical protein PanWU01x14_348580 [Parasponia andersonii]|uniref:Uncharacterized protein n=1 Tax=Parasponia andersonii TaxID=3476 RepID=A0A2P5ABN6_PARAD|nr:hypothetical protein PanWU01x14_348580 [Parasponia andersonii]
MHVLVYEIITSKCSTMPILFTQCTQSCGAHYTNTGARRRCRLATDLYFVMVSVRFDCILVIFIPWNTTMSHYIRRLSSNTTCHEGHAQDK